jgi:hypothetical protein
MVAVALHNTQASIRKHNPLDDCQMISPCTGIEKHNDGAKLGRYVPFLDVLIVKPKHQNFNELKILSDLIGEYSCFVNGHSLAFMSGEFRVLRLRSKVAEHQRGGKWFSHWL